MTGSLRRLLITKGFMSMNCNEPALNMRLSYISKSWEVVGFDKLSPGIPSIIGRPMFCDRADSSACVKGGGQSSDDSDCATRLNCKPFETG